MPEARGSSRSVAIDCFPASAAVHAGGAIVAVDVIRATTVAVTAVSTGRRCWVARDVDDAIALRNALGDAVLAGELGGNMPVGFDMNNSPADLIERRDIDRPLVLLSTSGTALMLEAEHWATTAYVACLRNFGAVTRWLSGSEPRVALIGAGSRAEFREEDQLCCSWIAERLIDAGYEPADARTGVVANRWSGMPLAACLESNSVAYLRNTGQLRDLDFITTHVDDLDLVCLMRGAEVVPATRPSVGPPESTAGPY
jgi:2-phosphosulfolactate phosphatase